MPRVRVTMLQEPIDVPDEEIPVLRAQGLLVEDEPEPAGKDEGAAKPPAPVPPAGAPAKPAPPAAE